MMYSPDSVNYLLWARSLARGEGFNGTVGPEADRYVANAPLYPVLLAPAALLFPSSIPAAKAETLLAGACMIALFQVLLARRTGAAAALAAGAFLALHPLVILYATQVLSDIPFALCALAAVALLGSLLRRNDEGWRTATLLALAATAAVFLREAGIALLGAVALALAIRRKFRPMLTLLALFAVAYGLWFLRNEIIVARAEHPALRNMALLFSRAYTPPGASAFAEIGARLGRSITFYGGALLDMVGAPLRAAGSYSVTAAGDGLLRALDGVSSAARIPLALVAAAAAMRGVWHICVRGTLGVFFAILALAYGGLIAMYPVSDVRFLFPVLLAVVWTAATGLLDFARAVNGHRAGAGSALALLPLVLVILPDGAWVRNVVSSNLAYGRDPAGYDARAIGRDPYPEELTLLPRPSAGWIASHSTAGAVVGSKIKAAGLFLEGRPLVVINPLIPVEEFDNRIRDYGIGFLLCELQAHQVPDFAFQMALSPRFRFTPLYRFGDTGVFGVSGKENPGERSLMPPPGGYGSPGAAFMQAVYALQADEDRAAAAMFDSLGRNPGLETASLFYGAIAHEFAGDLAAAAAMFARFRTIPQSVAYQAQARVHEDIIVLLRETGPGLSPAENASLFREAATDAWTLGFRVQAARMLRQALRLDPGDFGAVVLGTVLSIAAGDTAGAREGARQSVNLRPADPLTLGLAHVLAAIDSLPRAPRKAPLELAIGREYVKMGLYEMGIDQALKALREGENPEALRMLEDLYRAKGRQAPARAAQERLERLTPGDTTAPRPPR